MALDHDDAATLPMGQLPRLSLTPKLTRLEHMSLIQQWRLAGWWPNWALRTLVPPLPPYQAEALRVWALLAEWRSQANLCGQMGIWNCTPMSWAGFYAQRFVTRLAMRAAFTWVAMGLVLCSGSSWLLAVAILPATIEGPLDLWLRGRVWHWLVLGLVGPVIGLVLVLLSTLVLRRYIHRAVLTPRDSIFEPYCAQLRQDAERQAPAHHITTVMGQIESICYSTPGSMWQALVWRAVAAYVPLYLGIWALIWAVVQSARHSVPVLPFFLPTYYFDAASQDGASLAWSAALWTGWALWVACPLVWVWLGWSWYFGWSRLGNWIPGESLALTNAKAAADPLVRTMRTGQYVHRAIFLDLDNLAAVPCRAFYPLVDESERSIRLHRARQVGLARRIVGKKLRATDDKAAHAKRRREVAAAAFLIDQKEA